MVCWYCSIDRTHRSRYAPPASVIEYTLRAGPPEEFVSHSDSHSPSFSIFLKVRYTVPGFTASKPK